jgi:hypothetical protein
MEEVPPTVDKHPRKIMEQVPSVEASGPVKKIRLNSDGPSQGGSEKADSTSDLLHNKDPGALKKTDEQADHAQNLSDDKSAAGKNAPAVVHGSAKGVEEAARDSKRGHGGKAMVKEGINEDENGGMDVAVNVSRAAPATGKTR